MELFKELWNLSESMEKKKKKGKKAGDKSADRYSTYVGGNMLMKMFVAVSYLEQRKSRNKLIFTL